MTRLPMRPERGGRSLVPKSKKQSSIEIWAKGDLYDLFKAGGPEALAQEAALEALREEREFWLDLLERIDQDKITDALEQTRCREWIKELRRRLGIKPPKNINVVREQTRQRVKRHRARHKSGD